MLFPHRVACPPSAHLQLQLDRCLRTLTMLSAFGGLLLVKQGLVASEEGFVFSAGVLLLRLECGRARRRYHRSISSDTQAHFCQAYTNARGGETENEGQCSAFTHLLRKDLSSPRSDAEGFLCMRRRVHEVSQKRSTFLLQVLSL